jgi:hypothetical protein
MNETENTKPKPKPPRSENGNRHRHDRRKGKTVIAGDVKESLLAALRMGLPLYAACDIARVNSKTLLRARQRHPELDEECRNAQATLMLGCSAQIMLAAKNGSWQAGAWLLERRFPQHYAQTTRQEISGPGGMPLAVSNVDQAAYIRAVRRALGFNDPEPGEQRPAAPAEYLGIKPLPGAEVVDAEPLAQDDDFAATPEEPPDSGETSPEPGPAPASGEVKEPT